MFQSLEIQYLCPVFHLYLKKKSFISPLVPLGSVFESCTLTSFTLFSFPADILCTAEKMLGSTGIIHCGGTDVGTGKMFCGQKEVFKSNFIKLLPVQILFAELTC